MTSHEKYVKYDTQTSRRWSLFKHYTNPKKYSNSGSFLVSRDGVQFEKNGVSLKRQDRFPQLLERVWGQAILSLLVRAVSRDHVTCFQAMLLGALN
jgi:hypothetical protein